VTCTSLNLWVELLPYLTPPSFYVKTVVIYHTNSIKHSLALF